MTNPDLCSFYETRAKGFAHRSGVLPAHAAGDVHLPDVFRGDAEMRLERWIDPLVHEAPSERRTYCEEKIR